LKLKDNLTSLKTLLRVRELILFWQNLRTNLSIFDLARLWLMVRNTRFDKINFVNLEETKSLSPVVLADGSQVLTYDQTLLDFLSKGLFKETNFVKEHLLIEVLNGTEKQGLAGRVARLITNLGGEVVTIGNSSQKINQCRIEGESRILQSFTAKRLGQIFDCQMAKPAEDSRADLRVIIGQNYWQRLYQRK